MVLDAGSINRKHGQYEKILSARASYRRRRDTVKTQLWFPVEKKTAGIRHCVNFQVGILLYSTSGTRITSERSDKL